MADRFWVGGGASTNWNATGNTNWSATSGGANNASVPGTGDNVFFDANSGAGASVLSASQSIGTLDMTGASISGLTHNNAITLTVDGAGGTFLLATAKYTAAGSASNVVFTGAGTFNVTPNGNTMGSLTVNGASAVVVLQGHYLGNVAGLLGLTLGTFDANDFNVTTGNLMDSSGTGVRTLSMGSGTWTSVSTNGSAWQTTTTTNLTFNKETANIVIGVAASNSNLTAAMGGLTYNDLTINAANANVHHLIALSGAATFANLSIGAGNQVSFGNNITISNAPTWAGTSATRPIVLHTTSGIAPRTITVSAGNASLTWGYLAGIALSGGSPTATNTLDGGNNSGWVISAPGGGSSAHVIGG